MLPPVQIEEITVHGTANQPIQLPIAQGPATGYAWQIEPPARVHRITDGPSRAVDPSVAVGGAAGGNLRLSADDAGDYVVLAKLVRPWEPDRPARIVRIHLHVDK